jgi:hypothetical protein
MTGKNRIMIFGPNPDGTYVVEFRTAKGETLAISVPSGPLPALAADSYSALYQHSMHL